MSKLWSRSTNDSIIIFAFLKQPYEIFKTLISAEYNLKKSKIPEQRFVYLFNYVFIFEEIRTALLNQETALKDFFFNDVIHTICNLINSDSDDILIPCLKYFEKFCRQNYEVGQSTFAENLIFIVEILINKSRNVENEKIKEMILGILTMFLITWKDMFTDTIDTLPELIPSLESLGAQFGVLSRSRARNDTNTLIFKIKQFLNVKLVTDETLTGLKSALCDKKEELVELYKESQNITFSEDCIDSPLHQLVTKLLKITKSNDSKKALLAATCLGELGPYNLSSVALISAQQLRNYECQDSFVDYYQDLYKVVVENLPSALAGEVEVKSAASGIAIEIFQTHFGRQLIDSYPRFKIFVQNQPTVVQANHAPPCNAQFLKNIFCPTGIDEYKLWLQHVVISILNAFGDKNIQVLVLHNLSFAEDIFPLLVKLLFVHDNDEVEKALDDEANKFFELFYVNLENGTKIDKSIVKSMLMLVEYYRIQYQAS